MGYIKDESHFINYLLNVIKRHSETLDMKQILPISFYLKHIYHSGLTNEYTWMLRNQPEYLYENNLLNFISIKRSASYTDNNIWTRGFLDFISELSGVPGVYIFESTKKIPLYVRQSINLKTRIVDSYNERFKTYDRKLYLKCIKCETAIDSAVIEVYLIGLLKPVFNGTAKYIGDCTVTVENIPEYTDRVLVKSLNKKERLR